jgi:hypothetical protein
VIQVSVEAAEGFVGVPTGNELLKLRKVVETGLFERKSRIEANALARLEAIGLRSQARRGGVAVVLLDGGTGVPIAAALRRKASVQFAEQGDAGGIDPPGADRKDETPPP